MKTTRMIAAAVIFSGLAVTGADAGERLSTRAIKALFPGTFHAVVKGYAVTFTARGDGKLIGQHMGSKDTGRWSVRRGRLCIMLKDWLDGKTSCSAVVQSDGWYKASKVRFRKL